MTRFINLCSISIVLLTSIRAQETFDSLLLIHSFSIFYEVDAYAITENDQTAILEAIQLSKGKDDIIYIDSHTDPDGSDEYNSALSTKRSNTISNFLIEHGVAERNIQSKFHGESQLISNLKDDLSKSKNRRTEVRIYEPNTFVYYRGNVKLNADEEQTSILIEYDDIRNNSSYQ